MASSNAPAKVPERQPEPTPSTPGPAPAKPAKPFPIRAVGMIPG